MLPHLELFKNTMRIEETHIHFPYSLSILAAVIIAWILLLGNISFIPFLIIIGVPVILLSVKYSEITLAIFLSIGSLKGDPRLSFMGPVDATVTLAILIIVSILFKTIIQKEKPVFPKEYVFYVPFIFIMLISLSHTPDFNIGFDKVSRFIVLTGLAIISPFFILESSKKLTRFLWTSVIMSFLMSLNSFTMLGGYERLVAPSGLTIQLGYMNAVSIAIIWYLIILPDTSFYKKIIGSLTIIVLFIALIGSGARSATIAISLCVIISFFFYRRSISYFFIIIILAILAISMVNIPTRSYEYLGTLIRYNPHELLGFRWTLMQLAWDLTLEYPLLGVGIGGYQFYSPNPLFYNWPHNVILEISSEMGILSALSFCAIIICSFWETSRQIMDTDFKYKKLSRMILALLIIGFITMLNTGDINEVRPFWLYMSLPFVLRGFQVDN